LRTTKNALIRYRIIDHCLKEKSKNYNWEGLAQACSKHIYDKTGERLSFSERTIKGDISEMRDNEALGYFAPIKYDRGNKCYIYEDENYSITQSPISKSEASQLQNAIQIIKQYSGFKQLKGIVESLQKLQLLVQESDTALDEKIILLDQNELAKGSEWLELLYELIKSKKAVKLNYQPFSRESFNGVISPYLLKEYDSRWYVFAFQHQKKEMRLYALDRILGLGDTFQKFIPNESFDDKEYFQDIIGVSLHTDTAKQDIVIKVFDKQVEYLKTKKLHRSQILVRETKRYSIFQLSLFPNYELESLLLSHGEKIEILEPRWLRSKIKGRLKKGLNRYI